MTALLPTGHQKTAIVLKVVTPALENTSHTRPIDDTTVWLMILTNSTSQQVHGAWSLLMMVLLLLLEQCLETALRSCLSTSHVSATGGCTLTVHFSCGCCLTAFEEDGAFLHIHTLQWRTTVAESHRAKKRFIY